jgi:hypothetical protein
MHIVFYYFFWEPKLVIETIEQMVFCCPSKRHMAAVHPIKLGNSSNRFTFLLTDMALLPVVPLKAVAEVSKIGNL